MLLGTPVLLASAVGVLVPVNVVATGSVVRTSAEDDVEDLNEVGDGLVVDTVVDVAVDLDLDVGLAVDDLALDSEVGSVTSVVGRDRDDCVSLGIAVGIAVSSLVFVTGGNVIGPVPNSGTASVAVMTA
ncbi:hypothetical protein Trco_002861 [Trichoderma cornu-damae]|uniref:Secreted protein n=1 Tax=Trichoderma cornu-damae TaxID=654480 RepID=A0A9P8QNH3_9HYPO|nr:hypothetical protein Trco_002861 [Trichoderma cornu-damae]